MRHRKTLKMRAFFALALASALPLAGCDTVELHGSMFEAVGLTNKPKSAPSQVETRAPLIVPPSAELPPPAPKSAIAASPQNWPNDPDQQAKLAAAEEQRKKQDYYDSGDFSGKGGIDEFSKLSRPIERKPGVFGGGPLADEYRPREETRPKPRPATTAGEWNTQSQPATAPKP